MSEEPWYVFVEREAAAEVAAMLEKPLPNGRDDIGDDSYFDPWELFPSIYGTYSSEFDVLAVAVLEDLRDGTYKRTDLAAEILREMLCVGNLCNYGGSPRTCFPNKAFKSALPQLIENWRAWYEVQWGEKLEA
jgi:hypothetical protein